MGSDGFVRPEIPEPLRDMMKLSIEQARKAFETFAQSSERAWAAIETSSEAARNNMRSLNDKIAEITRSNAEANFALALKLAEAKDVGQAMELQSDYARKQMENFARQLEEIRDLATNIIQDAGQAAAKSSAAAGSASTPPSPFETGPTY